MAVPKRKLSRSRTRSRAAHHALTGTNLRACPRCTEMIPPHRVCPKCGHYRGREVVAKDE